MSNQDERVFSKDEEIRIHAINLAASTYRELFRLARDGEEPPALAEQVVADARTYEAYIRGGEAEVERARSAGYALAVERLRDDERYRTWWTAKDQADPDGVAYWKSWPRQQLADYLETIDKPLPRDEDGGDTRG